MSWENTRGGTMYCYYGFDKFQCFYSEDARPFRSCPPDFSGPLQSVHVGWANAIFVTEDGRAELRGLGGRQQLAQSGARGAALGVRGHWLLLLDTACRLGRAATGEGPSEGHKDWPPMRAAALGPCLGLLLAHDGSLQELQLEAAVGRPLCCGRVRQVSCGNGHQLALTEAGTLLSWGQGSRGQLGHGGLDAEAAPRELEALAGLPLVAAAAGGWHSAALSAGGDLYLWGWNRDGQLGQPSARLSLAALPRLLATPEGLVAVACGSRHTAALQGDGSAWAWGSNGHGQLGPGGGGGGEPVQLPAAEAQALACSPWGTLLRSR